VIAPVFVFDSREQWRPVGVEESLLATGVTFGHDFPDTLVGALEGRIDFPPDMKQPDLPPVGYHRIQQGGGLYWHQFWFWYLYNPWDVAGIGRHEGDWEFVQIGCTDREGDHPVLVTCSQHHTGGKREYWAAELTNDPTPQPYVYVALGSHATYFAPGTQGGGIDHCDAQGPVIHGNNTYDIEWRLFGSWASWPGRWGNSDTSPQSPACQVKRWRTPHLFHSEARG
jgi:hypothetical protein